MVCHDTKHKYTSSQAKQQQLASSGLAMRAIMSARSWVSVLAYSALRATPVPPGAVCAAPPNENCGRAGKVELGGGCEGRALAMAACRV